MLDQLSRLDMGLNLELKTYEDSDIEALVKAVARFGLIISRVVM